MGERQMVGSFDTSSLGQGLGLGFRLSLQDLDFPTTLFVAYSYCLRDSKRRLGGGVLVVDLHFFMARVLLMCTFIVCGHDITSNTIIWSCRLASNPREVEFMALFPTRVPEIYTRQESLVTFTTNEYGFQSTSQHAS